MIEKIKSPLDLKVGNYKGTEFDIIPADTFAMVCRKINELVEAVNNQQIQLNNHECRLLDLHSRITALEDPTYHEEPADPYEKQKKCLCKLCWFWNENYEDKVVGVLTGVFNNADRPFERNIDQVLYKHCEPVKPDSDIIYHGE